MAVRILLIISVVIQNPGSFAQINNKGFDLSNITIPLKFVKDGGPPRDGIPSIDNPVFINTPEADFLRNEDRILGVHFNGISKA